MALGSLRKGRHFSVAGPIKVPGRFAADVRVILLYSLAILKRNGCSDGSLIFRVLMSRSVMRGGDFSILGDDLDKISQHGSKVSHER